jgi:hypothetical protein
MVLLLVLAPWLGRIVDRRVPPVKSSIVIVSTLSAGRPGRFHDGEDASPQEHASEISSFFPPLKAHNDSCLARISRASRKPLVITLERSSRVRRARLNTSRRQLSILISRAVVVLLVQGQGRPERPSWGYSAIGRGVLLSIAAGPNRNVP